MYGDEIEVEGPAGGIFKVKTEEERDRFEELVRRYQADNLFTNVSDKQDLERVIHLEVLCLRYMNWLSTEKDYDDQMIDPREYSGTVKEFSGELRQLKKSMGIDKVTRSKESAESGAAYLEELRMRAKEFGILREDQLTNALVLFNELSAKITLMDNCTDPEKRSLNVTVTDIIAWIREEMIPAYEEIDNYFRKNSQKFWIRKM